MVGLDLTTFEKLSNLFPLVLPSLNQICEVVGNEKAVAYPTWLLGCISQNY